MRAIFGILLATMLGVNFAAAADAKIVWRLKQPFRYLTETADFDMHRRAMLDVLANGNPAGAILALEQTLNDPAWLKNSWLTPNANAKSQYKPYQPLYPKFAVTKGLAENRPERGWAHPVNKRGAFCWIEDDQSHSKCQVDQYERKDGKLDSLVTDYVLPRFHTVILRLENPPTGNCQWQALAEWNGEPTSKQTAIFEINDSEKTANLTADCANEIHARIPFEPKQPKANRGVGIKVTLPDQTILQHEPVVVEDRLIIGLGDSFASGEGNPDTPVELTPNPKPNMPKLQNKHYLFMEANGQAGLRLAQATLGGKKGGFHSLPHRLKTDGPAGWVDRKCHRSLYSHQFRVAAQIALSDPLHQAVTFLGFACSGAKVGVGLFEKYAGVEPVSETSEESQIKRLAAAMCRGSIVYKKASWTCPGGWLRQADLALVSIGGNDVGFVPVLADMLMSQSPIYLDKSSGFLAKFRRKFTKRLLELGIDVHGAGEAEVKAKLLADFYQRLAAQLNPFVRRGNGPTFNVLITAYPNIASNLQGEVCGTTSPRERMEGVNVMGFLSLDHLKLKEALEFTEKTLNREISKASAQGHWHFVDSHIESIKKHGFCAQPAGNTPTARESLALPFVKFNSDGKSWLPFDPVGATSAYAKRQRWVRTLNDGCLFMQYQQKGNPKADITKWDELDVLESCLGGAFHPTAEGQAAYADAVFAKAKSILTLPAISKQGLCTGTSFATDPVCQTN